MIIRSFVEDELVEFSFVREGEGVYDVLDLWSQTEEAHALSKV